MPHARILIAVLIALALFAAAGASPARAANCECADGTEAEVQDCANTACTDYCTKKSSASTVVSCSGGGAADTSGSSGVSTLTLKNPLGVSDPLQFLGRVIKGLLGIIGGVALALFIYGGFLWMTSGGSSEKIQKGRDTLLWTSIGLAVIFASYAMVDFIIGGLTGK